jgi:hypothetical protein
VEAEINTLKCLLDRRLSGFCHIIDDLKTWKCEEKKKNNALKIAIKHFFILLYREFNGVYIQRKAEKKQYFSVDLLFFLRSSAGHTYRKFSFKFFLYVKKKSF